MYIEFQLLPQGKVFTPNASASHTLTTIRKEIDSWIRQYSVVGHSQKVIKYTLRLGFNDEKYFSLFAMTWTPDIPYRLINIANERY